MKKNVKLEYYVLNGDFNTSTIKPYNVLGEWVVTFVRKNKDKFNNHDELKDLLKHEFMYYYWCKSEYEISVGGLFDKYPDDFKKIDVWSQIEPNLDLITSYIEKEMDIKYE